MKVFADEQRPTSWGADARDLCDIVHIVSSGNKRLALPFFTIEDMVNEWLFGRFMKLYYNFRFIRGDNTLFIYLLKQITAAIYRRTVKIYNTYGFSISNIEKERGTMDGKSEKKKYYVMNKRFIVGDSQRTVSQTISMNLQGKPVLVWKITLNTKQKKRQLTN